MVTISKPLSAGKVGTYYEKEYTNRGEAYYSQQGELRGQWHGRLAETFGLSGRVGKLEFERLAQGQDPNTGEQLVAHRDTIKTKNGEEVGHRAAWDLTFSAPKTVSLTALVGGDEGVAEAHRSAIRSALDATEQYVQARMGGNRHPETTGKWVAAVFEHDTARPVGGYPAPQLHTHVVMFNMTMADRVRSIDTRELFRVQSMSTAIYQAELAARLKSLGYEIEHGKNFAVEIKGYTQEYREAASARRQEILRQMEEKGISGAEAAERIAHQTRQGKEVRDAKELKAAHRAEAAKYGNQPDAVVSAARARAAEQLITAEDRSRVAHDAIRFARNRLGERNAVFDQYEIIRDSLRYGMGTLRLADVEKAFEERRSNAEEFIAVEHFRTHAPGARFTTPEMIRMERHAIAVVQDGIGKHQPIGSGLESEEFQRRFQERLNNGQLSLVWNVIHSRDQVVAVQGGAGTGKTTALRPLRELAEANGFETRGLAPTSGAAKALGEAGLKAETLQAHLLRGQQALEPPRLYFLDESSLSSTKQVYELLSSLKPSDRLLLIGDTRQHQSVEAGRIFEELQQAGTATYRLDQIVRQRDHGLRQIVERFAAGDVSSGLKLLHEQDRITEIENRRERFQAIAQSYALDPQSTLVVSPDNESRKEINAAIRNELYTIGTLSEDRYTVRVLINRQEVTGEDRRFSGSYHAGNIVRYTRANKTVDVERGEYATVLQSDRERNAVTVQRQSDGQVVTYDPRRVSGVQVYDTETRALAVGERLQFTNPWKDKGITNREIGTVTCLDGDGNITMRMDKSNRTVSWNLKQMSHVEYGYAMTSYSAQGATVDRVLVQIDANDSRTRQLVDKTLAYVALSRPRYDAQVFTDSAEKLDPALNRLVAKPKALSPEQIEQYRESAHELQQAIA